MRNDEIELELTYLARRIPINIAKSKSIEIHDIYIPKEGGDGFHPRLRLRGKGDRYELTKKLPVSVNDASVHSETTINLDKGEFLALKKVSSRQLRKIRHYMRIDGWNAEIDVFLDDLKGLVVVDFEFKSESEKLSFKPPEICLADVTQEDFIAGGLLAGKTYEDIESELKRFNYKRLLDDKV